MTFTYDEDDDVLYVVFAHPKGGVRYVETDHGDVLRFSRDTNEIVGVTIMFFADRARRGETIEIPEVGVVAFSSAMASLIGQRKTHHGNPTH